MQKTLHFLSDCRTLFWVFVVESTLNAYPLRVVSRSILYTLPLGYKATNLIMDTYANKLTHRLRLIGIQMSRTGDVDSPGYIMRQTVRKTEYWESALKLNSPQIRPTRDPMIIAAL